VHLSGSFVEIFAIHLYKIDLTSDNPPRLGRTRPTEFTDSGGGDNSPEHQKARLDGLLFCLPFGCQGPPVLGVGHSSGQKNARTRRA